MVYFEVYRRVSCVTTERLLYIYVCVHLRLKSIILLIFPLFHLVTRFLTVFLLSCPFPKSFVKYLCNIKKNINKANKTLNTTTLRLASLSILLIVLCNPSILNPGPTKLSGFKCYFQNVQGLLTFSSLGKPFPNLNQTKISELQVHIFETSPDIVILNETWFKPTIKSNDILPTNIYIIFRLDRTTTSHPPDPDYPQKFKSNGGGVLIGIKRSLNLNPKLVNQSCNAEVLSIQLSLPDKKKICLSTVYRVGTLAQTTSFSYRNTSLQSNHQINLNTLTLLEISISIPLTGTLTLHRILLIHSFLISLTILASFN